MATKIKSYRAPVWKKGTNNAGIASKVYCNHEKEKKESSKQD